MKSPWAFGALLLVAVSVLIGWSAVYPPAQVPIIGILHPGAGQKPAAMGFMSQMRDYGYEDGATITYLYDGAAGQGKALTTRAQALVAGGAAVIYSASTPATKAALTAAQGTDTIVVFGPVNDPVAAGFVETLRAPGGKATGVTLAATSAKRLSLFKDFDPSLARILVPFNPDDTSATTSLARIEPHAVSLGLEIMAHPVNDPAEVLALLEDLPQNIDAMFLPRDSMISSQIDDITKATIARKIPLSVSSLGGVEKGALFSYGIALDNVGQIAARLTRDVLSGTDPAIIPVEVADSHLFINKQTARAIGLDLGPALLSQAKMLLP